MKQVIHCTEQAGGFDIRRCHSCRYFEKTISSHISVSCRKNNQKPFKARFESLYFSAEIGRRDTAIIIEQEESK